MLRKITKLQNVGLFHSGAPKPVDFDQVTLVYAENGRGKSTIATLLRSCSLNDPNKLLAKKTIDSIGNVDVSLLFESSGKKILANFVKNAWNNGFSDIVVFDSEFVEQNVYSGYEVRSEQRRALLEFALGDQAVTLKKEIDILASKIEATTRQRSEAEKGIASFSQQIHLAQFIKVDAVPDALQQIDVLRKRIEAAKNIQALAQRQDPVPLVPISFNIANFFSIIGKKLTDIHQDAETITRSHFAKYAAPPGIEDWISRGQAYTKDNDCPFCGKSFEGSTLIGAYQSYFNQAYAALKQQVASLQRDVEIQLTDNKIESLLAVITTNTARIEAWKDQMEITAPTFLLIDPLRQALCIAREQAIALAAQKRSQPLEVFGGSMEHDTIAEAVSNINTAVTDYNQRVAAIIAKIAEFKKRLSAENLINLQAQIHTLELAIARYHPDAIKALDEYQKAEVERKSLVEEKTKTRDRLDNLMETTLSQYRDQINKLLGSFFGAGFTIKQMEPNYQGTGEPRADYVLQLRQKTVRLGSRNDTGPHFGTALSEGDKRTLAFAFFLARIQANPASIANQILVFDDPVSSLDRNRRAQTVELIASLTTQCAQMILFSHDAYFIREMREKFAKLKPKPIIPYIIGINRVQNDYSAFSDCDIDDICASDYYRHHCYVSDYLNGTHKNNIRDIAKALRPMIEGFYHRRFPRMLPKHVTFGQIIAEIAKAQIGSPISHLKKSLQEMHEVNEYASRFHHDTNQSCDTAPVSDGELKIYAKRTLDLIYKG